MDSLETRSEKYFQVPTTVKAIVLHQATVRLELILLHHPILLLLQGAAAAAEAREAVAAEAAVAADPEEANISARRMENIRRKYDLSLLELISSFLLAYQRLMIQHEKDDYYSP